MLHIVRIYSADSKKSTHVSIQGRYNFSPDKLTISRLFFRKNGTLAHIRKTSTFEPSELFKGRTSVNAAYGVTIHLDNGVLSVDNPQGVKVSTELY